MAIIENPFAVFRSLDQMIHAAVTAVGRERQDSRRQRMCVSKNGYSKREAQTVINHVLNGPRRRNRPESLRAYPCPLCNRWHITKDEPSED